ncbi:MAG: ABC transporter permease [Candidatus Dormibacteraeota bacterium]|nr:ABC transporter permease [Candidatus Dormibacteraeota bacterium]
MDILGYLNQHGPELQTQALTQLYIVAVTVALSVATGLPLGVLAARNDRFGEFIMGLASILLTIPSFALFNLLSLFILNFIDPSLAFGDPPTIAGLVLYAQLPIIRNARTGLGAVNPAVLEAARGMGMRPLQTLLRVELPLALPVILGGIRQATVMVTAIATVGAALASNNLGRTILDAVGSSTPNRAAIITGVVLVAAIGIAADAGLALVQRLISRGRITAAAAT